MTCLPSPLSLAVDTIHSWRKGASLLSSILTTSSGRATIWISVISMDWSRRIDKVFPLSMRSYGPIISLNHNVNRLITRCLFIMRPLLPIAEIGDRPCFLVPSASHIREETAAVCRPVVAFLAGPASLSMCAAPALPQPRAESARSPVRSPRLPIRVCDPLQMNRGVRRTTPDSPRSVARWIRPRRERQRGYPGIDRQLASPVVCNS